MLYSSKDRLNEVMDKIKNKPIICRCGTTMTPFTHPFSKDPKLSEYNFLRYECPANERHFIKSGFDNGILSDYLKSIGYKQNDNN
jgi:hypothetical protein